MNHSQDTVMNYRSNKFINMTKIKTDNISICLTLNLDQFIDFSSIKYMKNSNSDNISLYVYNNSPYKITLLLGLLGFCETNATTSPTKEVAYRVNIILQLLDKCQSTILDEELSKKYIISNEKKIQTISQKHLILNQHSKYPTIQKNNKSS